MKRKKRRFKSYFCINIQNSSSFDINAFVADHFILKVKWVQKYAVYFPLSPSFALEVIGLSFLTPYIYTSWKTTDERMKFRYTCKYLKHLRSSLNLYSCRTVLLSHMRKPYELVGSALLELTLKFRFLYLKLILLLYYFLE